MENRFKVKWSKKIKLKLLLAVTHGLFLVFATVLLQYVNLARDDEPAFLKWMAICRHNILHLDHKPLNDSVVFIDVSKDIQLIADNSAGYDPDTPRFAGPQQVITDRKKLAALFRILRKNRNGYRYIICDILFNDSSEDDKILSQEISGLPRIITAKDPDLSNKTIFDVPEASVEYFPGTGDSFYKWPLFAGDNTPTLPIQVYEKISHQSVEKKNVLDFIDGRLTFAYIIPEFYIRPIDLVRDDSGPIKANTFYLGQLLLSGNDAFDFLKNKYIIIGDFSLANDVHETYLGKFPGPLIVWNVILTLLTNRITVNPFWLLILWLSYVILSYFLFVHPKKDFGIEKTRIPLLHQFLVKYVSFLTVLMILDFISYLFFGTFISVFYIATWLTFLHLCIINRRAWVASVKKYLVNYNFIKR